MRNPKWHRDEVILALDLYFRLEPGQSHARNPELIQLSNIMNKLPIHDIKPEYVNFRNPNGISMKLGNFAAIDPRYDGKGFESYSKLDKEVFDEFFNKKEELKSIANRITGIVSCTKLNDELFKVYDDLLDLNLEMKEGKVTYKLHKYRERNSKINKKKKELYLKKHRKLDCEVCGFDFYEKYGDIGQGYIECHHKVPLSHLDGETTTKLEDLALVCANCHRMLHRNLENLSIEKLKMLFS